VYKLSYALVAGAVCAAALPASAQVVVNPPAAPQAQVVVNPPAAPQAQVVVNSPAPVEAQVATSGRAGNREGLIWSGLTMFAVSYSVAVISGAAVNNTCTSNNCDYSLGGRNWLFAPLVGPFIAMGDIQGTSAGQATARALLALDGLVQVGGAAMLVIGLVLNSTSQAPAVAARRIHLMPFATATSTGLAAFGHF
jgi:hypothetical protein